MTTTPGAGRRERMGLAVLGSPTFLVTMRSARYDPTRQTSPGPASGGACRIHPKPLESALRPLGRMRCLPTRPGHERGSDRAGRVSFTADFTQA